MEGVTPGKDEGGPLRVIVSRSHAGSVKETAQAAFDGREVTVTPAGGKISRVSEYYIYISMIITLLTSLLHHKHLVFK